ncbi:MAG: response regulator [Proteobacteria bacterium]|nr:response regulator [Pseudomonadota bacterium]MBU1583008.1 response regulator [Pseudomonadota bacterium]MBU2454776.1 response regulator [Pseudomonadota bacterium]
MKKPKPTLRPNLFERQVLSHANAVTAFLCVLVPTLSGFNVYCILSGRVLASVTLTIELLAFLAVLLVFRHPVRNDTKIIILRYIFTSQIILFTVYLVYSIGIQHQLEVTPWTFLLIFLLFVLMPEKTGGVLSLAFIGLIMVFMGWSDSGFFKENKDFLIRFYSALTLFSLLSFCSVFVRSLSLKSLEKAQLRLQESERAYRELSDTLLAEIKHRDQVEKKLHRAIKMETVGQLAAGVAHDLNNILSGIVTYPDLLLLDMKDSDPLRKPVEMIRNSGVKAAAIVEDLLTLARRGVTISKIVDLRQVVDDYLASPEYAKLLAYHPNINIKIHSDFNIMKIKGSPIHLSKAVMNLISNAAEAMPDGGDISIHIYDQYVEKTFIRPDDMPEGQYTVLCITDNGVGIAKEDIEKIFEPFYTKKTMGRSGTGLGMAVVLGTIKDHHAFIDVKSTIKKGTAITLFFPATLEIPETDSPGEAPALRSVNNEKILVIDDMPEQCEIATKILTRLGYDAFSCVSGETAVSLVKENTYDLMIIDMVMAPGIDGLETYKRILSICPEQKALFATGFLVTQKIKAAQNLGAGPCLLKPYSLEQMGYLIKKELTRKK